MMINHEDNRKYTINRKILDEAQDPKNETRNLAKYFIAEFQRQSRNPDKSLENEEAIKILKTFKKDIEEKKNYYNSIEYNKMINFLERFLPTVPSSESIRALLNTIDFSELKNKKQAVGIVKKHFEGNVDGNLVSEIIENEY